MPAGAASQFACLCPAIIQRRRPAAPAVTAPPARQQADCDACGQQGARTFRDRRPAPIRPAPCTSRRERRRLARIVAAQQQPQAGQQRQHRHAAGRRRRARGQRDAGAKDRPCHPQAGRQPSRGIMLPAGCRRRTWTAPRPECQRPLLSHQPAGDGRRSQSPPCSMDMDRDVKKPTASSPFHGSWPTRPSNRQDHQTPERGEERNRDARAVRRRFAVRPCGG